MEENDKPFACTSVGCNMRFTNEDHLSVHKRKHDMVLNLENGQKMNIFVADQTPTPTRFIRNCEEVGLFQDLQNVNPFEETFRKAVEAGKSGVHSLHEVDGLHAHSAADDSLHTPHVFPHIGDAAEMPFRLGGSASVITGSGTRRRQSSRREPDPMLHPTSTTDEDEASLPEPAGVRRREADTSARTAAETSPVTQQPADNGTVHILLRLPDGRLVQLSGLPVEGPSAIQASMLPTPVVLPTSVVAAPTVPTITVTDTAGPLTSTESSGNSKLALAKLKLKQTLTSNARSAASSGTPTPPVQSVPTSHDRAFNVGPRCRDQSDEERKLSAVEGHKDLDSGSPLPPRRTSPCPSDKDKRMKVLERNRAAAVRCREKRKHRIQSMEVWADSLGSANQQLQTEVGALRAEVAQLKTLLLAHRDCPVTLAMAQAQQLTPVAVPRQNAPRKPPVPPLILPNGAVPPQGCHIVTLVGRSLTLSTPADPVFQVIKVNPNASQQGQAKRNVAATPDIEVLGEVKRRRDDS